MKRILLSLSAMLMLFMMTGCGPVYRTVYSYAPPESTQGRMCVIQCQKSRRQCLHWASKDYNACMQRERDRARVEYQAYVLQQQRQNLAVTHDLSYFTRSYVCKKTQEKECQSDYRACYELCGGTVNARQECVANCN